MPIIFKFIGILSRTIIASYFGLFGSFIHLYADNVDFEYIFSKPYIGALLFQPAEDVIAYSNPRLNSLIPGRVKLKSGCIFGGGGDCSWGTLFSKKSYSPEGYYFYQVADISNNLIWIRAGDKVEEKSLDPFLGFGGPIIQLRANAATSDTRIKDGVPLWPSIQIEKAWESISESLHPDIGQLVLTYNTKYWQIGKSVMFSSSWDPHFKVPYNLSPSDFFRAIGQYPQTVETTNSQIITLTVLRRRGSKFLVSQYTNTTIVPSLIDTCGGGPACFWLETTGFQISYRKLLSPPSPIFLDTPELLTKPSKISNINNRINEPLDALFSNYEIDDIKYFNNNLYAHLKVHIRLYDPLQVDRSDNRSQILKRTFTIPLGWIRIRDVQGRLRFWFADESC